MARRTPSPLALANPFMLWTQLAANYSEMLLASGQVIHNRVGRMQAAGHNPSARDRKEFTRMGTEKLEAATRSAAAAGTRLPALMLAAPPRGLVPMMAMWSQWARLGSAMLQPIHATATANARRLGREKAPRRVGKR